MDRGKADRANRFGEPSERSARSTRHRRARSSSARADHSLSRGVRRRGRVLGRAGTSLAACGHDPSSPLKRGDANKAIRRLYENKTPPGIQAASVFDGGSLDECCGRAAAIAQTHYAKVNLPAIRANVYGQGMRTRPGWSCIGCPSAAKDELEGDNPGRLFLRPKCTLCRIGR